MINLTDVHLILESAAGPVHILRGINLSVRRGTSVSVVGPSGSGKSSLLSVIGGIERPTSGRVEVAGVDFAGLDEDGLALLRRDRMGILFQAFHLIPTMTAEENVALPLELAKRREARRVARALLAEVGLDHRLEHYPGQLSGGEQQRVALARALANEPEILLADEPTGNLDSDTGREIVDLLFGLVRARGMTLLLITHEPFLADRCDRRLLIENGCLKEAPDRKVPLAGMVTS